MRGVASARVVLGDVRDARRRARGGEATTRECSKIIPRPWCRARAREEDGVSVAEVFVACVPLEGFEGVASAASVVFGTKATRAVNAHWMVLVRFANDDGHASVYDFLPAEPKSPATAAMLLSGGSVRGEIRSRRMVGIPGRRCALVGSTRAGLGGRIGVESAIASWHARYDTDLKLGVNDCRNYAKELAKYLTCDFAVGIEIDVGSDGELSCRTTTELPRDDEDDGAGVVIAPIDVSRRRVVAAAKKEKVKPKGKQEKKSSGSSKKGGAR